MRYHLTKSGREITPSNLQKSKPTHSTMNTSSPSRVLLVEPIRSSSAPSQKTKPGRVAPLAAAIAFVCFPPLLQAATNQPAPKPEPVNIGKYLVGAMLCPLWRQESPGADGRRPWDSIKPYPEREPLLGFYNEGDPDGRIDQRMLLVDNWNEFGQGQYVFPTRQFGFGYLDAIRNVFSVKTVREQRNE